MGSEANEDAAFQCGAGRRQSNEEREAEHDEREEEVDYTENEWRPPGGGSR